MFKKANGSEPRYMYTPNFKEKTIYGEYGLEAEIIIEPTCPTNCIYLTFEKQC